MKHYFYIALASLALSACSGGGEKKSSDLEIIPLGEAFDNPQVLKASDCFKKIRYVALETTDSSLVGKNVYATVMNDWIVVISNPKRCHLFDKKTGRFIRSIGHAGQDPEAYADVYGGWQNPHARQLAFPGAHGKFVLYGADGIFNSVWTPPVAATQLPTASVYHYLDADKVVGYYPSADSTPARIILFQGNTILRCDTLRSLREAERAIVSNDIASIHVFKNTGVSDILVRFSDGKSAFYSLSNHCFWHHKDNHYFRQTYNDTIYRLSANHAPQPVRLLDMGTHGWSYSERFEDKKDAIYINECMETDPVILFRFTANLFNDKKADYYALYRKDNGSVKVWKCDEKISDDLNNFLSVHPLSVSASGEFVALLPADEVVDWFESHAGDADIPSAVEALKQVGEEDNPVVAIME